MRPRCEPDRYPNRFAHCDVLVVGAGPAGLAAALAAATPGARVVLCDEQAEFGGSLLADTGATIEVKAGASGSPRGRDAYAQPRVTMLTRTIAFGYFPHNWSG